MYRIVLSNKLTVSGVLDWEKSMLDAKVTARLKRSWTGEKKGVRPPGVAYTERGKRTLRPMMCIVDMESTIVAPHPLRGSAKLLLTGVILSCPLANLLCRKIAREDKSYRAMAS